MPYVRPEKRDEIRALGVAALHAPGDLNYFITKACNAYIKTHALDYNTINEIVGVLECAKLELYRRIAGPYEDIKLEQNGDVYDA